MNQPRTLAGSGEGPLIDTDANRAEIRLALFWITLLSMAAVSVIILTYIIRRGLTLEVMVMAASIPPLLLALELNRRDRPRAAGGLVAVVLILTVTIVSTLAEGINSNGIVAYPPILIISSLILRRKTIIQLTVVTILATAWLAFGEMLGFYQPNDEIPRYIEDFIVVTCILMVTAGALRLLSNTVQNSLLASQKELEERIKTERKLREAETLYRTLVEQTSVVTYRDLPDGEGTSLYISPQIEEVVGYTQGEWLSDPRFWQSLVHPDDLPRVMTEVRDILLQGNKGSCEYRLRRKDGEWIWVHDESIVIKNEASKALYVHGTFMDVTERKKTDEALRQYTEQVQQHVERLSMLNNIGHAVTTLQDLDTVLNVILAQVQQNFPLDVFYVCLYNRDTEEVSFPLYYENGRRWHEPTTKLASYHRIAKTLHEGHLIKLNRTPEDVEQARTSEHHLGDKTRIAASALFVPMQIGNRVIGAISLQSYAPDVLTDEHLSLLAGVAPQAAIAIENSRLYTAVQKELRERQLAEQELQKQRDFAVQVMNALGQGVTVTGRDGSLEYVNPAFARIAGCSAEELLGTQIESFTDPQDLPILEDAHRARRTGQTSTYENRIIRSDGQISNVLITGSPRRVDGEIVGAISVITDMTEMKKIQMEREALIRELESKNAELEQFTYTVSHDLKSPLITIRGYLPYLERDAQAQNKERLQQDIERIEKATNKMQMLLNELLELSRIGRVINAPEQVAFEEIVQDALGLVEGKLNARPVKVEVGSGLPMVHGDRARLVEVMQNLLDNAISYMGDQSQPRIEIGTYESNGELIFFVRDNGMGIDPKQHERVFGLFNKLNPASEGTGVGLALAKRIVEVHNGRIWVESDLGKGATFCFTLGQVINIAQRKETT